MISRFLLWCGIDILCGNPLCHHRRSEHDFDSVTPAGFCQHGDWRTGCDCIAFVFGRAKVSVHV